MKKFLKYSFTYFMGFVTCLAVIVGVVFWAVNGLTIEAVENLTGSTIIDDSQIDDGAEVNLKKLSLPQLIQEVSKISSESSTVTLDSLLNRYGLSLPNDVLAMIPNEAMSMPINKIFTEDGISEILEVTDFEYLYAIIGEDAFPEPLKSTLASKTLDMVLSGDLNYILEGVKLGYIAGVTYQQQGAEWVAQYIDPDNPTIVELLEGVDVSDLLAVFNEGGDLFQVFAEGAGDVPLNVLIESFTSGESLIGKGATVGDFYELDPVSGTYSMNLEALVMDMCLGHVMGYTPIEDGDAIIGWTMDGTAISTINETIANIPLVDVMSGALDVMGTLGDLYVGELLGYTPVYDGDDIVGWKNGDADIDEVIATFASAKVSDLIDGTFDVAGEISSMTIADILALTSETYDLYKNGVLVEGQTYTIWYDGVTVVDPIIGALANKTIGELTAGISDFAIGTLTGYTKIDDSWYTVTQKPSPSGGMIYDANDVTGIIKYFVGLNVEDLQSGDALESVINDIVIGEALGYVNVDNVWYENYVDPVTNTPVEGILKSFVGLTIESLRDGDVITSALQNVIVGEEMGYYKEDGVWYTDETKTERVTGILASIADMSVGDLSNEDAVITIVNEQSVGEMLGYYESNDKWYKDEACTIELVGITKTIAKMKVGDLSTAEESIKDMKFGDVMGYHEDPVLGWVDANNESHGKVMSLLCGKKIHELESTVDGLTIGDVFSETEREGVLSLIEADTKITDISGAIKTALQEATLGDYIGLGILQEFDSTQESKLDFYAPGWESMTIEAFMTNLINNIPAVPGM